VSEDYDYRAPAVICAVTAGGLFAFFIVSSILWRDQGRTSEEALPSWSASPSP